MTRESFRTLVELKNKRATLFLPNQQGGVEVVASVLLERRFLHLEDGSQVDADTFRPSGRIRAPHSLLLRLFGSLEECRLEIPGEPEIIVQVGEVSGNIGGRGMDAEGKLNLMDVTALLDKYRDRRS